MLSINPLNGQIRTKKKLSEYAGIYQFVITLMDNGPVESMLSNTANKSTNNSDIHTSMHNIDETNLSGSCLLEILVKEYNMYAPKFLFPNANNSMIRIKSVSKTLFQL